MRRFVILVLAFLASGASPYQDKLWHLRNLGKAFYENPTVAELSRLVEQAPKAAAGAGGGAA